MVQPIPFPQLRRTTLSDDVYDTITSLIMAHTFAPGDRLNIDALSRQLAVSATPVREALLRLEADGLVRKRVSAGYTVSPLLTRDEFLDMFDMRMVLEGAAARWAAARADPTARERIVEQAATTVGPDEAFTKVDARFHDLIAEATDNPLLRDGIFRLHAHLHIHRLTFSHGSTESAGREHRRVAAAINTGRPDAAEAAMRDHLAAARDRHLVAFG